MKIKKNTNLFNIADIRNDLKRVYPILIRNNKTYFITLQNLNCDNESTLRHTLTKLIKIIYKRYTNNILNYLFVIEYPEVISKGLYLPTNSDVHSHIVINTTLPINIFENALKANYPDLDYDGIDITYRNDKPDLIDYLIKQPTLNKNSYNFKIG